MTAFNRSTRYTARHVLRLWAWGIVLELPQMPRCYRRNRRHAR